MKKFMAVGLVLCSLIIGVSCTNNEGSSDIDIITPNDSTEGKVEITDLEK